MWKEILAAAVLLLFAASELQAARCKVDGKWYDYDSPQCNPNKHDGQESLARPADAVSASMPNPQPTNESPVISPITGPALMGTYVRPWSEVAHLAEQYCRNPEVYNGGPECLIWEERGYWAMHGNFAMPEPVAAQSKAICRAKTGSFRSQAMCMHNESMGYRKFIADSEMPKAEAQAARKECEQKLSSWSQRGSCVSSAIYRFKYPHGQTGRRLPVSASYSGLPDGPPGYAKESEVVTFRIRPQGRDQQKAVGDEPSLPQPMDIRKRASRMAPDAADLDVLAEAITRLETDADYHVLNAANSQIEGVASLSFSWPATVLPRFGIRFTEQEDSALGLALEVVAGRVYLVDFVVWAYDPGSYIVTRGSDVHIFEDVGAALRNVTIRLLADSSGTTGLSIKHQYGKGFTLFAVGVTSIDATGVFAPGVETPDAGLLQEQTDNL